MVANYWGRGKVLAAAVARQRQKWRDCRGVLPLDEVRMQTGVHA